MRVTQSVRARTRQALVRAGLELFATQGFSATTVEQVAAAAGVAKGTVYNYFPSKEELALAGLVATLEGLQTDMSGISALPTLLDRLRAVFTALVDASRGNPELIWVWTTENLHRRAVDQASLRVRHLLATLCAQAQERGELRSDRAAALIALDILGLMLVHIGRWHHHGAGTDLEAEICAACAVYLEGAMPAAPA